MEAKLMRFGARWRAPSALTTTTGRRMLRWRVRAGSLGGIPQDMLEATEIRDAASRLRDLASGVQDEVSDARARADRAMDEFQGFLDSDEEEVPQQLVDDHEASLLGTMSAETSNRRERNLARAGADVDDPSVVDEFRLSHIMGNYVLNDSDDDVSLATLPAFVNSDALKSEWRSAAESGVAALRCCSSDVQERQQNLSLVMCRDGASRALLVSWTDAARRQGREVKIDEANRLVYSVR